MSYGASYFTRHHYGTDQKRDAMYAQEVRRLYKLFPEQMCGGIITTTGEGRSSAARRDAK